MRIFFAFLLLVALSTQAVASSVVGKLKIDPGDLKSHEREAKYTIKDDKHHRVTWTSDAVDLPSTEKHNDTCARIPEYMDGMVCYKLCGGGLTSTPIRWDATWRPAEYGHNVPFRDCDDKHGCRGFNVEYYEKEKRGCVFFGFWKKGDPRKNKADMRVIVTQQH